MHGSGYWKISADEAMKLTRAAKNVARHYPMLANERTRDWYLLGAAIAMIEGPKLLALRTAKQRQQQPQQPAPRAEVTPVIDLWAGIHPPAAAAEGPL